MTTRFAIWTAVSTAAQVKERATKANKTPREKASLPEQLKQCRAAALAHGWVETAGPFTAPGYSRTRWINLSDAAQAIPALSDLLAAARRHEFDVLVLWDATRLRDLYSPLSAALSDQRIQIYSLAQPAEPADPRHYDPDQSDTADIIERATGMASLLEGRHRKRRWKVGMLSRVESGLQSGIVPFGYRKPVGLEEVRKVVVELHPEQAGLLLRLKDLFLAGRSLPQLVEAAQASGVPCPRGGGQWTHFTLRYMLANPYYAGQVTYGSRVYRRDRMLGRTVRSRNDPERVTVVQGRHPALWDLETHVRIKAEFRRRGHAYPGRHTHQLSQLLTCGECGARLWSHNGKGGGGKYLYWHCSRSWGHIRVADRVLLPLVGEHILAAIREADEPAAAPAADPRPALQAELDDLRSRRTRWQEAFETGALDAGSFAERTRELSDRIVDLRERIEAAGFARSSARQRKAARADLAKLGEKFLRILQRGDQQATNAQLREIIDHIVVRWDQTVEVVWRE